jgi:hypothetical protein
MKHRSRSRALAAGVILAAAPFVFAQGEKKAGPAEKKADKAPVKPATAPGAPTPAPELDQLKYSVGIWNCEGSVAASPLGPAHKTKSTVRIRLDLDGFWYSGTVRELKTAENPMPVQGVFHESFDPSSKQFVLVWVDNFGSWATSTAPAGSGGTMTFTGQSAFMGRRVPTRDVFTKKSDAEMTHTFEMTLDAGKLSGDETCRKAGSGGPSQ